MIITKQLTTAFLLSQLCGASLLAASVTLADPTPNESGPPPSGGIGYRWTVVLGANDSGTAVRHVGAWSWEDNDLFAPGDPSVGWTHTSDWVALTTTTASTFTLRLERQSGVALPAGGVAGTDSMFPSFTIWSGWDADDGDHHTYNNRGNVSWAEDITYLDHLDNSTQTAVERSWVLPAGNYTLALGSNAPATDPVRQGYLATFTTSAVPEPATSGIAGLLAAGALLRRKRTNRI